MATKRPCPVSRDLREGRENLKTGSRRATRNLFSPRRLIGRNDMVVDLNLGKVVIPKEEVAGVIKGEKISEELADVSDETTAVEDEEENIQVKLVGEEVDTLENLEADEEAALLICSCACWNKIESLEAIVEAHGRQIQNLNEVVMGLLAKQVASDQAQRPPGKEAVVHPVVSGSQPTAAVEIDSGKGGKGVNSLPVISSEHSKNECPAPSANAKKKSSRPLPSHPSGTGVSSKTSMERSSKVQERDNGGVSGQKHASPHCSKEGRHRLFSRRKQKKKSLQKKGLKCDTCSKTFSQKSLLDQHIKSRHEGVRYQCTHCTGSYVERRNLIRHEKIHARGVPLIRCKLCGLDLISDESLKMHLGRCHGGGKGDGKKRPKQSGAPPPCKKVCPHCEKGFDCDASLRYHLHKKHGILQMGNEGCLSDGVQ